MIFIALVGIAFARFYWFLPRPTQIHFMLAAITFVAGAIGVEMLSGMQADQHGEENSSWRYLVRFRPQLVELQEATLDWRTPVGSTELFPIASHARTTPANQTQLRSSHRLHFRILIWTQALSRSRLSTSNPRSIVSSFAAYEIRKCVSRPLKMLPGIISSWLSIAFLTNCVLHS